MLYMRGCGRLRVQQSRHISNSADSTADQLVQLLSDGLTPTGDPRFQIVDYRQ